MLRRLAILALVFLAACQTVPRIVHRFTLQQAAALTALDFKPVGENYELGLNERLLFDIDSSNLTAAARQMLGHISATFKEVGIHGAALEGHTDSTGAAAHNRELSLRRAVAVKAALVVAGMADASVRTVGKGEGQPIASNTTSDGRAQNRRVVIIVTPEDAS
jgi:outer membrane protein OmpA-like peptidoglycan-associated protein